MQTLNLIKNSFNAHNDAINARKFYQKIFSLSFFMFVVMFGVMLSIKFEELRNEILQKVN